MKKVSNLTLAILIAFSLYSCLPSGETFPEAICISDVTIVDPELGAIPHQTVILQDEKILKIAPHEDLQLSSKNTIVDGSGKFLIPGLWDAHVHFAYIEDLAPSMFDLFLGYGITSVRDTGGRIDFITSWKDKASKNPNSAPRVMIAGPLLDGMPNVYDGGSPQRPPLSVGLPTVEAAIQKVNELDSLDVDLLKAYEMLTPEQLMAIAKIAKEKGLKVTGHVPLSMDVIGASNAGLSSMEHMRNLELSCASNADELLAERRKILQAEKFSEGGILRSKLHDLQRMVAIQNYDENKADEILKVLAENETWQIPTLALNIGRTNKHFEKPEWKKSISFLPESIASKWEKYAEDVSSSNISQFQIEYSKWLSDMVGKIHRADIEIMAGTDCPIFFLTPGQSLHEELNVLVKAGLTPLEALKTATINPAKYFNMQDELGQVKEGMFADLVLLDANPIEDIANTQRIHSVIKNGTVLDRASLDKMLERAKNP